MLRYVKATRQCLKDENWHAALFIALSMPDICGWLEDPKRKSGERFVDWFNRYLAQAYAPLASDPWLTGGDCYALRCALLHSGVGDISAQRIRNILDEFCFISPDSKGGVHGISGHCNRVTNCQFNDRMFDEALFLRVTDFCEDICKAVEKWVTDTAGDPDIKSRMSELLTIY